jgi:RNA polymerase primary sigma factor
MNVFPAVTYRTPTYTEWAEELNITVPQLKGQLRKSQKAKAAMMEANLRLVVTIARQTIKQSAGIQREKNAMLFQDVCQEGIIGLSKACERFDPSQGVRFNTFAKWFIRRGILDSLATNSRLIRLPRSTMKRINTIKVAEIQLMGELGRKPNEDELAERLEMSTKKVRFYKRSAADAMSMDRQLGSKGGKGSKASGASPEDKELTLGQTLSDGDNKGPAETANQKMLQDDVRRMVLTLSPKEQAVVRMRFGLDDGQPQTHDTIATRFRVTKERIRKIEAQALLKMRQPYRNQSVQCYKDDI